MKPTDKSSFLGALQRHGFHFSKGLGQNFLIDEDIPKRIAESCGIENGTGVLEIGPGIGALTRELCERAEKVAAVEIDRALSPVLSKVLAPYPNVHILWGDVLKINLHGLFREHFSGMDTVLCANLPYYITTPVVTRFLEDEYPLRAMTLMVQREVAERLCAGPGPRCGAITHAVAYRSDARILFYVPPESFFPKPKVESAVVRMTLLKKPRVSPLDSAFMFGLIRAAFAQRRKTLQNALCNAYGRAFSKTDVSNAIQRCGLSPNIRGEALSLEDFSCLSDTLVKTLKNEKKNEIF